VRIAYVVDAQFSALGIAAQSRAKINAEISIIEALKYRTPRSLMGVLLEGDFDLVIFSWRFLAYELFSFNHLRNQLIKLRSQSSIAIVIPDHMGEQPELRFREDDLIQHVDYFLVTSKLLFSDYSGRYPEKCRGILHDIPNIDEIRQQRSRVLIKRNDIIWVGNSAWGERIGFKDYKRYSSIVLPLVARNHKIKIIDSAESRLTNQEVLREIHQSFSLIQCSTKEGTGLPLLEAAGLGVIPISTKVGVAEEVLTGELKPLLVEPNVDGFSKAITWANENFSWLPEVLIQNFEQYCHSALGEQIYFQSESSQYFNEQNFDSFNVSLIKWFLRFYKHQFRAVFQN
jgi:glycosyltransferase involved in cell wall biosynthesis